MGYFVTFCNFGLACLTWGSAYQTTELAFAVITEMTGEEGAQWEIAKSCLYIGTDATLISFPGILHTSQDLAQLRRNVRATSWLRFPRILLVLFIYLFSFFRAAPMAYGGSQARGPIRATATPDP